MHKNIILGIDQNSNIEELLNDGIRQFYFGYIPTTYTETYASQVSLNRRYRTDEQFTSLECVYAVIEKIHKRGGSVYLALNAFGSNALMLQYSEDLYDKMNNKVDGIIVANITMASLLKRRGYKKIVISNLFGVYTPQAVAFLQAQFYPMKIILPRDISLQNIAKIVTAFPKQAFECFLYGDNCRYSESFCFTEHGYDSIGFGSLCSFASSQKRLIKAPVVTFKHIVKDTSLDDSEKREKLKKKGLDIVTLLEELQVAIYENNFAELSKAIEILERFDMQNYVQSKLIFIKALTVLKNIDMPKAQKLYRNLKMHGYQEEDTYRIFHNLNSKAIADTLAFFKDFKNIESYKIPSRGRDHYKYLLTDDEGTQYNYKESQYKL